MISEMGHLLPSGDMSEKCLNLSDINPKSISPNTRPDYAKVLYEGCPRTSCTLGIFQILLDIKFEI